MAPRHKTTISISFPLISQFNLFSPPEVVSPDTLALITLISNLFLEDFFPKLSINGNLFLDHSQTSDYHRTMQFLITINMCWYRFRQKIITNRSLKMENIFKLNNINLNYNLNGNNIRVLKNINFEIKKNERVAIIGESGSGKTSLLMLMSGLEKPTTG